MDTKYIHHIYPHSPFPYAHPSHWYSPLEKTYFTLLSFIFKKCILMVQYFGTSGLPYTFLTSLYLYHHFDINALNFHSLYLVILI
jgi:hypothetical protein